MDAVYIMVVIEKVNEKHIHDLFFGLGEMYKERQETEHYYLPST